MQRTLSGRANGNPNPNPNPSPNPNPNPNPNPYPNPNPNPKPKPKPNQVGDKWTENSKLQTYPEAVRAVLDAPELAHLARSLSFGSKPSRKAAEP